jgi:ATP-dependent DNA helicase RecQ
VADDPHDELHDEIHDELHDELHDGAVLLLRRLAGRPEAAFREGQWAAIQALVRDRRRVLVVQRTGWGKSAVYFIATRLLRDRGAGPTILVSPLLALMRNQIEAAERMGVRARTINSANPDEWAAVVDELRADEVDLLLISPERLANRRFREEVLDEVGALAGLVVIDEAHCISDWGHDFRPDYRRIRRILDALPRTVPVLACTATANDRVVDDIVVQLGDDLVVERGALARSGLALHVIDLPSPAQRMAWLAQVVPTLDGTGIVYCLTKRDAEVVTGWLLANGIEAGCYTGDSEGREELEQRLLNNEVKVVVATSALGMGFDKPDLAFVVHFQAPGTPIAYYQQVGRAGRQIERSVGVLLRGSEDGDIQDWFISRAFPTREEAEEMVAALDARDGYTKLAALEATVNVRPSRIELLMKNLEVDGAVVADGKSYQRTSEPWAYDAERVDGITALRRHEQEQMREYASPELDCRMAFLQRLLDDPDPAPCGVCDRCAGSSLPATADAGLARRASMFVRERPLTIEPRRQWPTRAAIPKGQQVERGRSLCRPADGGWSELVRQGADVKGTAAGGRFADELVVALADLVRVEWRPEPTPTWLTFVAGAHPTAPSDGAFADLADRLGVALGLPVHASVEAVRPTRPQEAMENSTRQLANVRGAFAVREPIPTGAVLLLDETVHSRWTLTEVGSLLRQAGCPAVHPLAVVDAGPA